MRKPPEQHRLEEIDAIRHLLSNPREAKEEAKLKDDLSRTLADASGEATKRYYVAYYEKQVVTAKDWLALSERLLHRDLLPAIILPLVFTAFAFTWGSHIATLSKAPIFFYLLTGYIPGVIILHGWTLWKSSAHTERVVVTQTSEQPGEPGK